MHVVGVTGNIGGFVAPCIAKVFPGLTSGSPSGSSRALLGAGAARDDGCMGCVAVGEFVNFEDTTITGV